MHEIKRQTDGKKEKNEVAPTSKIIVPDCIKMYFVPIRTTHIETDLIKTKPEALDKRNNPRRNILR